MIESEQTTRLSQRDCERLLDLLENPPKPNARLQAAMTNYQQVKRIDAQGISADSSFNWQP